MRIAALVIATIYFIILGLNIFLGVNVVPTFLEPSKPKTMNSPRGRWIDDDGRNWMDFDLYGGRFRCSDGREGFYALIPPDKILLRFAPGYSVGKPLKYDGDTFEMSAGARYHRLDSRSEDWGAREAGREGEAAKMWGLSIKEVREEGEVRREK